MTLFEIATRKKYRFPFRGSISTEDLWDLNVEDLNSIYKTLTKAAKADDGEESLLSEKKPDVDLTNKIEIVKQVFTVKREEAEAAKAASDKAKQKERLLEILAKKQDDSLTNLSEEELRQKIEELT